MKYDAFISYRHAPLDMDIAKRVHSGLESFHIPAPIQKKYGKKKINRVFRDQEELPIGSDLNDNISKALSESEYLIVICSPRTPESYWVCKEIETFISMHDRQHVLAVLVEGEPDESFPQALLVDENGNSVEPLAADVRGRNTKERREKLKTELIRLAAPLIGCTYDDLKQRHRERRLKKMFGIACGLTSAAAVLGIGFSIYNASMAAKIDKNYKLAVENECKYMADTAQNLFEDGYREDAILVALEAFSDGKGDVPYVPQVECALSDALYTYDTGNRMGKDGMLEHEVDVAQIEFDEDKCHLLTVDHNYKVYIWDVKNGNQLLSSFPIAAEGGSVAEVYKVEHVGEEIIVCSDAGVDGYSLEGERIWSVNEAGACCALIDVSKQIAVLQSLEKTSIIDITARKVVEEFEVENEANYEMLLRYDRAQDILFTSYTTTENKSYVLAKNLSNHTEKSYPIANNYIKEVVIAEDGYLYVLSYDSSEIMYSVLKSFTACVEKIDLDSQEVVWCYTTEFAESGINEAASAIMKYRHYDSADYGENYKELVLSCNSKIISLDATTGEERTNMNMSGAVRSVLLAANSSLGYVALSTGNIEIVDMTKGVTYSDYTTETNLTIEDVRISEGIMVVMVSRSSDVLIMRYHTGENIQSLFTAEQYIREMLEAPDGKTIAVVTGDWDGTIVYLLSKENGQIDTDYITSLDLAGQGLNQVVDICFTEDNQLMAFNADGKIASIDPKDGKINSFYVDSDWGIDAVYANKSMTYAVVNSMDELMVVDMVSKTQIGKLENDLSVIGDAVITEDGKSVYYLESGQLYVWEIKNNQAEAITAESEPLGMRGTTRQYLAATGDGSFLAVACLDSKVRIYDTKKKKLCAEIEYASYIDSMMYFTKDMSHLVLQGDDGKIRIYDTKNWNRTYVSNGQYNKVSQVFDFSDQNRLALAVGASLLVLETDGFIPVAEIEDGELLTEDGMVILCYFKDLYAFPYQTHESLKEAAQKQLNGKELSEEKRIKYHMGE